MCRSVGLCGESAASPLKWFRTSPRAPPRSSPRSRQHPRARPPKTAVPFCFRSVIPVSRLWMAAARSRGPGIYRHALSTTHNLTHRSLLLHRRNMTASWKYANAMFACCNYTCVGRTCGVAMGWPLPQPLPMPPPPPTAMGDGDSRL